MSGDIAPQFEKLFPELAEEFRALDVSVFFRAKPGRKSVSAFTTKDGILTFFAGVDRDDFQLTFNYTDGGKTDFLRPQFVKRCRQILEQVREDRAAIAPLTLRQRYERLRKMAQEKEEPGAKFLDDLRSRGERSYFVTVGGGSGDCLTMNVSYGDPRSAHVKLWRVGRFAVNGFTTPTTPPFSWKRADAAFEEFEAKQSVAEAASP